MHDMVWAGEHFIREADYKKSVHPPNHIIWSHVNDTNNNENNFNIINLAAVKRVV